ncbi:MAG: DUF6554 family protein [Synechococcus sp.]|nr:DUF6554 family protein [Synechococcus sp.]
MVRNRMRSVLSFSLLGLCLSALSPGGVHAAETIPHKGAQVYCYMRSNGNPHNVSWEAAYALIKRQKSGVFKTSPEHAAVMITEAVVNDPGTYPECGRYLGDLFTPKKSNALPEGDTTRSNNQSSTSTSTSNGDQRYSY